MYKIETHLHSSEVSPCGHIRSDGMIRAYHRAGYHTVIVTDHFHRGTIDSLGDIPWEKKTTIFLTGYYRAREEGRKLGMNVLLGAEIEFVGEPNHYLAYGISKEFMDAYPNLHRMNIQEFSKIAQENGILLIQAHPFRDNKCYPTPEYVDGIEVYNGNPRHNDFDQEAKKIALEYNLYMTSGSDAHQMEDIGVAGMMSEHEIKTMEEFMELIKSGQGSMIKE